jgi:hypothetical protein
MPVIVSVRTVVVRSGMASFAPTRKAKSAVNERAPEEPPSEGVR